ncbi:glucosaminidase domain-containing protein [Psychroflexus sp. ALD_RP9]|uniref:glucosaminidase domain-containing protein n=1 Tax=Psychroflexus sp. ALD_RP9 TaxID=2777186 RepID=UPI001A8F46C9|nr:glucosaminidase domain-containing protein [Psychroflexus sp. ALD_RP9]QSS97504.1 glucosaminidase domain-containing protein [Psychroflexus sp. ALD_RP9]
MKKISVFILIGIFVISCGTKKKLVTKQPTTSTEVNNQVPKSQPISPKSVQEKAPKSQQEISLKNLSPVERYIYNFAGIAQEEMRLYGIPASITLAQGILESGSGNGPLTQKSNNHFGIKCNGWQGEKVYHDDDELQECFRKYKDPKYSFRDHSLFLYERSRYAFLFDFDRDDYKSWARGLKKAGYATDPAYPRKLISLIERYDLHRYDLEVLGKIDVRDLPKPIRVQPTENAYRVKAGDTLYGIAQKFNLTVEELKTINRLNSNTISIGQLLKLN